MLSSWSTLGLIIMYLFKVNCMEEMAYTETTGITYNETTEIQDIKRPIWNIAHMVNSIGQVDDYLDRGSNSLEFDVSFDWEGMARYVYHGYPCDCFRSCSYYEEFVTYIEYLRTLTSPESPDYRKELVLLFLDCKVHGLSEEAKMRAGEDLAMKLLDHYWRRGISNATSYLLISVPSIAQVDFVESFRNKMKSENFTIYDSKIGFDFSGNEDLDSIQSTYDSVNIDNNIWQGDGITNCLPRRTSRLKECLSRRESSSIDKVYWWTVDRRSTMRAVLRIGVDGMITNSPERLVSILNEDEFSSRFRLATLEDNPWETFPLPTEISMNFLGEGREENITDFFIEDEILYNCEETVN